MSYDKQVSVLGQEKKVIVIFKMDLKV
jgi:hypothetical protein